MRVLGKLDFGQFGHHTSGGTNFYQCSVEFGYYRGIASTQLAVDALNLLLEALFGVKLVSESSHENYGHHLQDTPKRHDAILAVV